MGSKISIGWVTSMSSLDFSTKIGSKRFSNPIFTASGCASSGQELSQFFPLTEIGAIVTKSIMTKARTGRATPRMAETPSGMLNSIGLQGPGIDAFLENDIPWLVSNSAKIIVSIAGETVDEYGVLARRLRAVPGISAVEVNISCPNVENRGQVFACHPDTAIAVIESVRRNIGGELPIIAKLSPDVTNIVEIAQSAIRPVAVRAIYQVHQAFPNTPIVGMGGVASGRDAFELVLAGASAVSIGTATFGNPTAVLQIRDQLSELLLEKGITDFRDAIGFAHRGV